MGPGTILATNEAREVLSIEADRTTLYGDLILRVNRTTARSSAYEGNKVRLVGRVDTLIEDVTIDGARGTGIFIGSAASRFTIRDVRVRNTRADGIHISQGSHDGTIVRPHVSGQGDDGVAVVSYADQPEICRNIVVDSPVVENQYHGRGVTVVGGDNIEYRNIRVTASTSAGLYIAAEPQYDTYGSTRIRVLGGTITRGNVDSTVGHGAVLVYADNGPEHKVTDVRIDNLRIVDTRTSAPSVVGVRGPAANFSRITLTNLAISGTHPANVESFPAGLTVTTSGWTLDGRPYTPTG